MISVSQNTSAADKTDIQLSTCSDRASVSGCSEDSKPDSGRGLSEDATSEGPGSSPRLTAQNGPVTISRPDQSGASKADVRRELVSYLQDADVDMLRNGHVHFQAPAKRRVRMASQV